MRKISEIKQDLADANKGLTAAEKANDNESVKDAKELIKEFEDELKEAEEKEKEDEAKEKKEKAKAKKEKPAKEKTAKPAKEKEEGEEKVTEVKRDRLFGKGTKFDLKIGQKVELKDKTEILLSSDDKCVLIYKGDAKRTVAFTFEDGKWHIDCCERGKKPYPEFEGKGAIEEAVDYILEMLECREVIDRKKKQRSATKKKHGIAKTPAAKVEDIIESAAEKVEKVTEGMEKKGKTFTAPQLRDFAKEAEDMIMGILTGIDNAKDKKTFISALRAAISKAEKTKLVEKKSEGGSVADEISMKDQVINYYLETEDREQLINEYDLSEEDVDDDNIIREAIIKHYDLNNPENVLERHEALFGEGYAKGGDVDDPFIVHGNYTISNTMGYEVQFSDSNDSARVRPWGSNEVSDWMEIEYISAPDADEDDTDPESNAVIDPKGLNIPLNMVMRANYGEGGGLGILHDAQTAEMKGAITKEEYNEIQKLLHTAPADFIGYQNMTKKQARDWDRLQKLKAKVKESFADGGDIKLESFQITAPIERENVLKDFMEQRGVEKFTRSEENAEVTYAFNVSDVAGIEEFKGMSMQYGFKFAKGGIV